MFFWFSINNFKINNILNYNLQSFYYKTKSIILKSSLSASNSTPPSHPPKILRSPRKNSSEFNALLPKKVWNDEKEDRNVMKFCLPLNPPPQKKQKFGGDFCGIVLQTFFTLALVLLQCLLRHSCYVGSLDMFFVVLDTQITELSKHCLCGCLNIICAVAQAINITHVVV